MSLFDRVLVIGLPTLRDRRQHIRQHLPEHGISTFSFFDASAPEDPAVTAADGDVMKYPPCFRCGGLDCGNPDCNNFLIPAQIATYVTYRRLWKHIAEGEAERVLVVEDDVWFHPNKDRVLSWVADAVEAGTLPFEGARPCLLRLGWGRGADHEQLDAPVRVDTTVRYSNPCHALTRAFARALLERDRGIFHTVDHFIHEFGPRPGEAFTVLPPIASELSWTEGRFASVIHPKAVHIEHLRQEGRNDEAAIAEARLTAHIKKKYFRPLLIVAHPRCGTGFAAGICQQLGLDVGHEKLGRSGISSWMFAVDADANPYALDPVARTRRALAWKHLVMPVRNLAEAAPSVMRDSQHAPPSYQFRRQHILEKLGVELEQFPTPFERAVRSIVGWARIVLAQSPACVFRIEDQSERLRAFLKDIGLIGAASDAVVLDTAPVNENKPYGGVRYDKPSVGAKDWAGLSDESKAEVEWYCQQFGYRSPLSVETAELSELFLRPSGWALSRLSRAPVGEDGSPLPWFTYGAIEFLQRVVRRSDQVFEYGAGYSTLWWQSRVRSVVSVEHDEAWADRIRPRLAANVRLEVRPRNAPIDKSTLDKARPFFARPRRLDWDYADDKTVARGLEDKGFIAYAELIDRGNDSADKFDFIVIDGMARRLCAFYAVDRVRDDGFIILDNSNRSDYDLAFALLDERGFKQVPFWGLVPGADFASCTSVFARSMKRFPSGAYGASSFALPEY